LAYFKNISKRKNYLIMGADTDTYTNTDADIAE
jgi:hypothetical protein